MSFDTEFDYSSAVTGISEYILVLQAQINSLDSKVQALNSTSYVSLVQKEIDNFTSQADDLRNIVSGYQDILAEINRLSTIPSQDKDLIYYFYTVLGVPKNKYMNKLLFNTDKVANSNVLAVYNDTTLDASTKLLVAQLLYDQFSIDTVHREISTLYTFLRVD